MVSSKKKLPVGLSDFKRVITDNYYYVDKSLLIQELIDQGAQALLIPRPRRFGKTLNLSMLRYFFEKTEEDTGALFRHLKIWQAGEEYTRHQGKYPVIFLSFKDVKEPTWESALEKIRRLIQEEFSRHRYVRSANTLNNGREEYFDSIVNLTASQSAYEDSLKRLCGYLARHHGQQVILLIDEYDTPIQAGYVNGYYAEVIGFMRNFLSGGLKDNVHLEKGVLTGIMRVAKESIFSGLNNLGVFTLLRSEFSSSFGLTEDEIAQALKDFGLLQQHENIRDWYDGYVFGDHVIYNPWSIINYLNSADKEFRPYWVNTSDNSIVEQILTRGGSELQAELESLINGEGIEKNIEENIVFAEIEQSDDVLWSFLLFGGYLKYVAKRPINTHWLYRLQIPNSEVRHVYERLVKRWFEKRLENKKLELMLRAFVRGDVKEFERFFRELVLNVFSYHDFGGEAEKVYQAFTIGLLVWLGGQYEIKSNRESGYGRYDVMVIPQDLARVGYVIEFKKVDAYENETPEIAVQKALLQIEEKKYAAELFARGLKTVKRLAIVFEGKRVWVKEA